MNAPLEPPFDGLDSGDMAERIRGVPEQIEGALARLAQSPWRPPVDAPDLLAVGAMGGSAISADLSAALYEDRLPAPIVTVRDYAWPAHVGRNALALLSSYSGHTEETLSLYREAGRRGTARVAITTGGELGRLCAQDGVQAMVMASGSPPRAAMFESWVLVTGLLHALGWVDDPRPAWGAAARRLDERAAALAPDVPEARNEAKQLARSVSGRIPLVYAGSRRVGPVATRFRQQLNENAKVFGHSALVPELNHNEIVGWEKPGAALGNAAILLLHDAEDSPEVRDRLELTAEYATKQGAVVHDIRAAVGERLVRLAELIQLGDYLSLYLAFLNGVDPTPIASIDAFKRRLAERGAARAAR